MTSREPIIEKFKSMMQGWKFRLLTASGILAIFGYFFYLVITPVLIEFNHSFAMKEFRRYGVVGTYQRRFFSFFMHLRQYQNQDQENKFLLKRLAILEKQMNDVERNAQDASTQKKVEDTVRWLKKETGSELARVMNTIPYRVPKHMLPHQLYSLAVAYFREGRYEPAAVILSHLTHLKEGTYQKPDVWLMEAMTWYHLKHWYLAQDKVQMVKATADRDSALYRKSILWEAMIAASMGNKELSQSLLDQMIAKYPHSAETKMINSRFYTKNAQAAEDRSPARDREPLPSLSRRMEFAQPEETPNSNLHDANDDHSQKDHSNPQEDSHAHE